MLSLLYLTSGILFAAKYEFASEAAILGGRSKSNSEEDESARYQSVPEPPLPAVCIGKVGSVNYVPRGRTGGGATPFFPARRPLTLLTCPLRRPVNFHYSNPAPLRIIEPVMEGSAYRIIDANFNRAREAARLIEEFCRFVLDSQLLTTRAKQLRHRLSAAVNELDTASLICSRDTLGDVGIGRTADSQLPRGSVKDCFTAACKRLTEALRVLAEMAQTLNPSVAEKIENLRYTAYTLEKDITIFAEATEKFKRVKLYVIINSQLPAEILSLTCRCAAAGADCIQLRAKNIDDDKLFAVAAEFVGICKYAGALAVINDRVDIAVAAGADGVHLGQNDLPVESARKLCSYPLIIGKSTHSPEQLKTACRQLPTYVSLGPVFATPTKPDTNAVGLDYIMAATKILAETGISNVAVGGITSDNIEQVLAAGAGAIAVCSAVTQAADQAAACRLLKDKITTSGT